MLIPQLPLREASPASPASPKGTKGTKDLAEPHGNWTLHGGEMVEINIQVTWDLASGKLTWALKLASF